MTGQKQHLDEKSSVFADNLRQLVGGSYVFADSLYGIRSWILAKGYQEEMKHHDKSSPEYDKFEQDYKAEMGEVYGMGLWGAGGTVMALFGNRSAQEEMQALSKKLASFLQDEGVNIQSDALAKALEEKNKSVFDKVIDFAYRYPSEIMHTCFALGSLGVINGGLAKYGQDGVLDRKYDPMTLGQGIVVLMGALIGMFVPEKTPKQIAKMKPATNSFEKASRFVQQHANKFTSGFYLANNGFSAVRMMNDKKTFTKENWAGKAEQSKAFHNVWKIRGGALATYLLGAGALFFTSKTNGSGEKGVSAQSQIFAEIAELITEMPEKTQKDYIQKTAKYLTAQRELGMAQLDPSDIVEKISAALEERQQVAGNAKTDSSWQVRSAQTPSDTNRGI